MQGWAVIAGLSSAETGAPLVSTYSTATGTGALSKALSALSLRSRCANAARCSARPTARSSAVWICARSVCTGPNQPGPVAACVDLVPDPVEVRGDRREQRREVVRRPVREAVQTFHPLMVVQLALQAGPLSRFGGPLLRGRRVLLDRRRMRRARPNSRRRHRRVPVGGHVRPRTGCAGTGRLPSGPAPRDSASGGGPAREAVHPSWARRLTVATNSMDPTACA